MSWISEEHESESGLVSIRISREVSKISRRRERENSLDIAKLETKEGRAPSRRRKYHFRQRAVFWCLSIEVPHCVYVM